MKLKRLMALGMAAVMTMSLTACGGSGDKPTGGSTETDNKTASNDSAPADSTAAGSDAADGSADAAAGGLTYAGIKLGEDYTDITTTIKWMHHKTDRVEDGTLQGYIDEFNKVYPNITVEQEGITDYAETALLRLPTGDWGDIMCIPTSDMNDH